MHTFLKFEQALGLDGEPTSFADVRTAWQHLNTASGQCRICSKPNFSKPATAYLTQRGKYTASSVKEVESKLENDLSKYWIRMKKEAFKRAVEMKGVWEKD